MFRQNFIYFSLPLSLVLPLGTCAKSLTSSSSVAPDIYLYTLIKFPQALCLHAGEPQPLSATTHVRQASVHYLCVLCWSCSSVFSCFGEGRAVHSPLSLSHQVYAAVKDQMLWSARNTSANADPVCCNSNMLEYDQLVSQELQVLLCRSGFQSVNPHRAVMLKVFFLPRCRVLHFPLPNCMKFLFTHYSSLLMTSKKQ